MDQLSAYVRQNQIALLTDEPLSRHTTFHIGGPARYFAQVTARQLPGLAQAAAAAGISIVVLGKGSNILARDQGYNGLVLRLQPGEVLFTEPGLLTADAGCSLSALAAAAREESLTGLEFAGGIPGTVGGAVYMNAGAYDGQISDSLISSLYVDLAQPQAGMQKLEAENHRFGYRTSYFKERPSLVILQSSFRLNGGVRDEIEAKMQQLAARRREKQPLELPSAGSVFKRPEGQFAGALIEECGLKGRQRGGAQVSEKHAGFIVNRGGATAQDVMELIREVQEAVWEKKGVRLEREIRYLG